MKKIFNILIIAFVLSATLVSCSKENDAEAPVINIISPTISETFVPGDTIFIKINITENDELHHIDADLYRNNTTKVWSRSAHSHAKVYNIDDAYIVKETDANSTFKLEVMADDHNGNQASTSIEFQIGE
jgi:hypothetical protein